MATTYLSSLALLSLASLLSLSLAQNTALAPSPPGPVNLTGVLDKGGQFTTFIRLLASTQVGNQIENQLNGTSNGFTVFAPTDNAFNNLKAGAINALTNQQQVQLVLYHVVPQFYTESTLLLVPNPVRTQASGQDGGVWGLNFTGQGNQVNVSTGVVATPVNNALRQDFPLAVYEVDDVLLPEELFGVKAPTASPAPPPPTTTTKGSSSGSNSTVAAAPTKASGSNGKNAALGLVVGLGLACMGLLS